MLNDMAQTLCPMVLQEGLDTGAGEAPEKASRKASRCRAYPHGQEQRSGQCVGGDRFWKSLGMGWTGSNQSGWKGRASLNNQDNNRFPDIFL